MRGRWSTAILIATSILAASCSGGSVQSGIEAPTGVLTGSAQACSGIANASEAQLNVYERVLWTEPETGQRDFTGVGKLVASQNVPNNGRYRFVLRPGQYYIANTSTGYPPPLPTSVSAGQVTRMNVLNRCF